MLGLQCLRKVTVSAFTDKVINAVTEHIHIFKPITLLIYEVVSKLHLSATVLLQK